MQVEERKRLVEEARQRALEELAREQAEKDRKEEARRRSASPLHHHIVDWCSRIA